MARMDESISQNVVAGWKRTPSTLVVPGGSNCSARTGASPSQNAFELGFRMAESILFALTDTAEWLTDNYWEYLFQAPPDEGIVYVLCGRSAEYVGCTQACRLGPRRTTRRIGGTLLRFFEHLGEMQLHLTRTVKLLSDTPAGRLTILEVSSHSLEQARALERVIIRTWAPICNTRGLHEIGRIRPRRLRPRPRTRPVAHLRSESPRQSTPLDSLYAGLEEEVTRWHACRSRWLTRQQALRDLSSGFDRFYKQSLDSRLAAGLGPHVELG